MNYLCSNNSYTEIFNGIIGPNGFQGVQGPQGLGILGPQGMIGQTGLKGITGTTGPQGFTGPQGSQGTRGITGPTGSFSQLGGSQGDYLYWNNSLGIWNVGSENIILGKDSGKFGQNQNAISIGNEAGFFNQQNDSIAIGYQSGYNSQGKCGISIGNQSGKFQKDYAIAIGNKAGTDGFNLQINNSIILNASGNNLTNIFNSGFYVNPIRQKKYDPSSSTYQLYYYLEKKEIIYNLLTIPGQRKAIFYANRENPIQALQIKAEGRFYITAVGGGGGGSRGFGTNSGGGGGSGGALFRYPVNVYNGEILGPPFDANFVIYVGTGGQGATGPNMQGQNGDYTRIYYYAQGDNNYDNFDDIRVLLLGAGGGGGGSEPTDSISISGAGGSVEHAKYLVAPPTPIVFNANYNIGTTGCSFTPYPSPNGVLDQNGQSGKFIFSVVVGSSGGSGGTTLSLNGKNGGRANGFYVGGVGGNSSGGIPGGGGGASSILGKGGQGEIPFSSLASSGSYGAGGGGGLNNNGGDGGDGIVIIEW